MSEQLIQPQQGPGPEPTAQSTTPQDPAAAPGPGRRTRMTGADDELIDPLLAALVWEALAAARFTDGDVDPTLGRAMQRNGYPVDIAQLRAHSAQSGVMGTLRPSASPDGSPPGTRCRSRVIG